MLFIFDVMFWTKFVFALSINLGNNYTYKLFLSNSVYEIYLSIINFKKLNTLSLNRAIPR